MILNFKIDQEDTYFVSNSDKEICLSNSKDFSYTFWAMKDKYENLYNTKALDLLYLSMSVFSADRLNLRIDSLDGWSREYLVYLPVMNLDLFNENKTLMEDMLSFLTGDKWHFEFRERAFSSVEKERLKMISESKNSKKNFNKVCMFSGGLDSFIGAIDVLEENQNSDILFVSHYGGGKGTKEYQDFLKEKFIEEYDLEASNFKQFYAKVVGGIEDTTRSRSFMFFSHAIAIASAMNGPVELIIPENGLISLNIPSTYSRLGTSSTRTTHPKYMKMFQQLLDNFHLDIHFKNPYQFKTKGEMMIECKNQTFMKGNYTNTMSCSHPDIGRMKGETEAMHCGYCLPCIIRRAAIKKASISDESGYRDFDFSSGPTSKMIFNSYKLGLKKFNPEYAFLSIQSNGSIEDNIIDYSSLYVRGMQELKEYLDDL